MKRVFLTGASSGIGLAIARLLVAQGNEVWGTSRSLERIPKIPRLHPVRLDLAAPDSIEDAFQAGLVEAGHFDVLINNAGGGHFGPAESLSAEAIASQFQILVFGQVQLIRLALRCMQARGEGLIINVTSLASFTMSIQLELSDSRVRLVDVQPGDIRTEFNENVSKSTESDARYDARVARTWHAVERNMQ